MTIPSADLVPQWRKARLATTNDTVITDYDAGDFDVDKAVKVLPYPAIALRVLGTDADGEAATITISGWGYAHSGDAAKVPGHQLWKGTVTLGGKSYTGCEALAEDSTDTTTYYEAESWNASVSGGHNAAGVRVYGGANHFEQAIMLLPTLGYAWIMLEVSGMSMATTGILWRPLTAEQVPPDINTDREATPVAATIAVAAGPTATALVASPTWAQSVTIQARNTNTATLWVGDSSAAANKGHGLQPGDSLTITRRTNLNLIYINGTAAEDADLFYLKEGS